ncbi:MAG TPA: hypothetical protein VGQ29_14700 [Gemmatimonadales bacterium]|jgi:hypothetical protein|nr:hypothetical protein [Gemmatimonadales bacterium]
MKALGAALLVIAAVAACGEGRAIFNVDVLSFLKPSGKDTVPYAIPPNQTDSASTFQTLNLAPGLGSSIVESATIDGTADMRNTSGTGQLRFRLYLATDSAGTLDSATAFAFGSSNAAVSGTNVTPITVSGGLTPAVLNTLSQSSVWVRIVAKGQNADLITPVVGKMVLTKLDLRVVLQDKVF